MTGLSEIPRDLFTFAEFRLATFAADTPLQNHWNGNDRVLAGETVIYSLGADEVDDQARREVRWGFLSNPGDILYRLEQPQSAFPQRP